MNSLNRESFLSANIMISTMTGGGAERVVSELLSYPNTDISFTLSLFTAKDKRYSIKSDVTTFVFEDNKTYNRFSSILYRIRPRVFFSMYMHYVHLHTSNYSVSISFLNLENCVNILVSKYLGIPTIVSIRNNLSKATTDSQSLIIKIQGILLRLFSPYVIVNSKDNREWLINSYNIDENKVVCIYNPKNIEQIQALSTVSIDENFFQTDEVILLTVGRLIPQKGHIHILRIFSELKKITPSRLVICGVGELEKELKKLASELGISGSVLFTGWCDNPYKYMKHADIFVFPSLFEGQPNAIIEALICGCPIVSTDCDYGPREILSNGKYGLLTKKLDGKIEKPSEMSLTIAEQDMYDKILYLIQNPYERERLSKLSAEQIPLFNRDTCIKKYHDAFRAAAEGKSLTDNE